MFKKIEMDIIHVCSIEIVNFFDTSGDFWPYQTGIFWQDLSKSVFEPLFPDPS